jgi:hypothetical protein
VQTDDGSVVWVTGRGRRAELHFAPEPGAFALRLVTLGSVLVLARRARRAS